MATAPDTLARPRAESATGPGGLGAARPSRVGLLAIAATLAVCTVPFLAVLDDPDLWWHLRTGHWILDHHLSLPRGELFSFTAAGNALTPHEWGSEVLMALLDNAGGLLLVTVTFCLLAWTGLIATAWRCRLRSAPVAAIVVALLVGAKVAQPVTGPRPQMLSFALALWVLLLAERHLARGGRAVWLLPPLVLVWANLHAGFVIGVGLLAVLTGIEAVRVRLRLAGAAPVDRVRTLARVTAAAAVAACVNPNGPNLYRFALVTTQGESRKPIAEWQSPDFHQSGSWALLVLVVAFIGLAAAGRGPGLRDTVLGLLGITAALVGVRNSALCAGLAAPGLAVMLGQAWEAWPPPSLHGARLRLRPASLVAVGAGVLLVVTVGLARAATDAGAAAVAAAYPECAARALAAAPAPVAVFATYADAGYLVNRDWPQVRVFEYGESISLGDTVFADYLRIASGAAGTPSQPGALALLQRHATTGVLTAAGGDLDGVLRGAAGWRLAAVDHGRDLFLVDALAPATAAAC